MRFVMAPLRAVLLALGAVLYAAGFVSRKVFVEAPLWLVAAVRVGWEDASK